jgi:hypothetical protein
MNTDSHSQEQRESPVLRIRTHQGYEHVISAGRPRTHHTLHCPLHRLVVQVTKENSTFIKLQNHVRIEVSHRAPALPPVALAGARTA